MPTTLKDPYFTTKVSASWIRDHEHAFQLIESFVGMDEADEAFLPNGSIAASVISWSKDKIKTALSTLSPADKAAAQTRFLVLKWQLDSKKNIHRIKKRVETWAAKTAHTALHDLASNFVKLIQEDLLPLFSLDVVPSPASPTNLFEAAHTNDVALLLLPKVKESISDNLPIEWLTKSIVATSAFRTDLNSVYILMRAQASADVTFMKKKWLRDNPVIDLSAFIDDSTYLPSLKLKLEPLYRKIRDLLGRYEKSIDVTKDTGWWLKPKQTKVSLDSWSNAQVIRADLPFGDYIFNDGSFDHITATDHSSHTIHMSVVDDKWNDCTEFVSTVPVAWPSPTTEMRLKTKELLRKYPDAYKLTVKRPVLLWWSWTDSALDTDFSVQSHQAEFIDEIKFWWLEDSLRDTMMFDFFNDSAQKNRLVIGLCAPESTVACKWLLKSLFKKSYSASHEKDIHEALKSPVTEVISWNPELDAESAFYVTCWITSITYADRLLYSYLLAKANDSRTESMYEVHLEELLASPKNMFTKSLNEDRCREFTTKIDALIAAHPSVDIHASLWDYVLGGLDVAELLHTANQPHPDAAKKTYRVNTFFDGILWSNSRVWKMRRQFRLWRQSHSLTSMDRIDFRQVPEIHDYRFIMWLWDNEGDEKTKKITLSGDLLEYENADVRIHIESATGIDVDVDIPAQNWAPALKFDGARWTPAMIRSQMDSEIIASNWWDRKLWFNTKMQLEDHLYHRLVQQHGDVSARLVPLPPTPPAPSLWPKVFTLNKWEEGIVIIDKWVTPHERFTMEQCVNETQAIAFLSLVRKILDEHCKSMKELLCNWATNATDVILWFPKLSTIEAANGSTPDNYNGERSEEKQFGSTTIKVTYKSDEKWSYKLFISDWIKEEEFDSVGEIVMSVRYGSYALDLMHWFHEKLLEEFLLKRKDLPRDRTYLVQDPITQDRYWFYHEWNKIQYWLLTTPPTTGVMWLTTWQKMKDVDPDPKQRCVMYAGHAIFVKGSQDVAKKTIFWRKDLFYSLLFTAMATSISWPKERAYRDEQRAKRTASTKSTLETLIDISNRKNLFDIVKSAFWSTKKK